MNETLSSFCLLGCVMRGSSVENLYVPRANVLCKMAYIKVNEALFDMRYSPLK